MASSSQGHEVLSGADSADFHSVLRHSSTRAERRALGKSLRHGVPRSSLGVWSPPDNRPDPVALIRRSHDGRVAELVGIRVARMLTSPFGFLRGAAVVMAWDNAHLPATGITPVVCGDSHLGNFGFYRSPEGDQVIDLNDFDEAHPGSWEWDLRRLTASIWVAGRTTGASEQDCAEAVHACVEAYREQVRYLASEPLFRRSFNRLDVQRLGEAVVDQRLRDEIERSAERARRRTSDRALPKYAEDGEHGRRIVQDPPLIVRVSDEERGQLGQALDAYLATLPSHWARVVGGYTLIDVAHKVVGVGSVGLRAYVALLQGSSDSDVLFLQLKQARRSVLAPFVHGDQAWHDHQGHRVVEYQQALQTVSDPLLGWTSFAGRQYYVRQFRNMKGSVQLDTMTPSAINDYARIIGALLAKGHARTSGASMIAGYLGSSDAVADALEIFARRYADQTEADHAAFSAAASRGELPVAQGYDPQGSSFRPA